MTERTINGFFYGLFMDEGVLRSCNIEPRSPRRAYIDNYKLHIGKRATLWPSAGDRAYGVVYSLTHTELNNLYSGAGLNDYKPEAVLVIEMDGKQNIACLCFNLPAVPSADEKNSEYAGKLQDALIKLSFPQEYVKSVRLFQV